MILKLKMLRSLTRMFIILVSLRRSLFSEKMLIFNRCISGLMSNWIKKSWKVSKQYLSSTSLQACSKGQKSGGHIVLGGDYVPPPLVEIGLTDPPKSVGGGTCPPGPPLVACLHFCIESSATFLHDVWNLHG